VNLVVSQALALGLPVLATRHSGLPEQVIDGKNGLLVEEGDHVALAERIVYLAENPDLLPAFSRRAREHVEKHYDSATLIVRQIEMYRSLLDPDR
jgi:colanic acid/amylovoran biosynthesis glycosyltransferase